MPASNIRSVDLAGSRVIIEGELTGMASHQPLPALLHVWLAQPGCNGKDGAGLAIDCINNPAVAFKPDGTFTLTADLAGAGNPGVVGAFVPGPATVSAIAVLSPKVGSPAGVVTEVMQWSHTVTVPKVW